MPTKVWATKVGTAKGISEARTHIATRERKFVTVKFFVRVLSDLRCKIQVQFGFGVSFGAGFLPNPCLFFEPVR
ncbi:MAG: hypothetical protein N3B10_13790 [Armatimonadetes bacterium]|nr:hypothetical protein [Armatimonadota bacterium]